MRNEGKVGEAVIVSGNASGRVCEKPTPPSVRLLYVCDFPPSNIHGGGVLLKRLLQEYPQDCITVFTGSPAMGESHPTDRLECRHVAFPILGASRFLWFSRVKRVLNWAIVAFIAISAVVVVKLWRVGAILTVLQGTFYFAAAVAGWITRTPFIVMVHDDFIFRVEDAPWFSSMRVLKPLSGLVLRRAAHVYSVSPEMQRFLLAEFGVESELQWPATEAHPPSHQRICASTHNSVAILFAGGISYAVEDSLELLAQIICSGKLKECGFSEVKLHLYTKLSDSQRRNPSWNHPDVLVRNWVPQSELPRVLATADILFLPYSFLESSRHAVETAFPSKTADYLAAGKPVLVFGPSYSSLVRYASEQHFAEVVREFSADALVNAIRKIMFTPGYRDTLARRALELFYRDHDIDRQRREFRGLVHVITRHALSAGPPSLSSRGGNLNAPPSRGDPDMR